MNFKKLSQVLFGPPRDPFKKETRQHIVLVAFMAWIGLGADGLSSANYGPEEAFLALGVHTQLSIYLALATAATVFIISLAYIQVIELFPNGGGGYKVASTLIGPYAGLISGSALIIDYVLTIAISVASGVDALFSFLPMGIHPYKVHIAILAVLVLIYLNLRGIKESIMILMPIFLGFVFTHGALIIYGIFAHAQGLPNIIPEAAAETSLMSQDMGWLMVLALFFKAFSLGGGTYTGLEAVSNNVNTLAEPKVRTGKWTMLYVACSLAFMAAGIILLYLLWDVEKVPGMTLNASAFSAIMQNWRIGEIQLVDYFLPIVMLFAAGLLFVAANTGFLAGPAVLANMATDHWMPHFFSSLSSRLVTKNGIVLMGIAAVCALVITGGAVSMLVVLYSINVFLTFSLSLLGLCIYWIKNRKSRRLWLPRFTMALLGFSVTSSILAITVFEKYAEGGWMTILITSLVILIGWRIRKHYDLTHEKLAKADELFVCENEGKVANPPVIQPHEPTAVFIVHGGIGSGMHTLLWVLRLFPGVFKNFLFLSVGEVDSGNFGEEKKWSRTWRDVKQTLRQYVNYCHHHNMPANSYVTFGTDVVEQLTALIDKIAAEFPRAVFFTSKLVFDQENLITHILHNQTAYILQRRLHNQGRNMIILPMKV